MTYTAIAKGFQRSPGVSSSLRPKTLQIDLHGVEVREGAHAKFSVTEAGQHRKLMTLMDAGPWAIDSSCPLGHKSGQRVQADTAVCMENGNM